MVFYRLEKKHDMLDIAVGEILTKKELKKIRAKEEYFSTVEVNGKRTTVVLGRRFINYHQLTWKEVLGLHECNLTEADFEMLRRNFSVSGFARVDDYKYEMYTYEGSCFYINIIELKDFL